MKYRNKLVEGTLLKRYANHLNFLVEISSSDCKKIIRSPNTKKMPYCDTTGSKLWYSESSISNEEFLDTWELVEVDFGEMVNVNFQNSTSYVIEGILKGKIKELSGYDIIQTDVSISEDESIDIYLQNPSEQCYLQVESVISKDPLSSGYFPIDPKHKCDYLHTLIKQRQNGYRAVLFYCIQHTGINSLSISHNIHEEYANTLQEAIECGVEIISYKLDISKQSCEIDAKVPVSITSMENKS